MTYDLNKKRKMKRKAQIFSVDLIVAVFTFILILISSIWLWTYTQEKMDLTEKRNDLELITKYALASLVETPGNPSNWTDFQLGEFNETNIYSLGLARTYSYADNDIISKGRSAGLMINNYLVLDESKIERLDLFDSQKYNITKRILGVLGPNYEFQLDIKVWNGNSYVQTYQIGMQSVNASDIIRADRYALLNGNWTQIVFKVWQECSGVTC